MLFSCSCVCMYFMISMYAFIFKDKENSSTTQILKLVILSPYILRIVDLVPNCLDVLLAAIPHLFLHFDFILLSNYYHYHLDGKVCHRA